MLHFSGWKITLILLCCVLGIAFAVPNFFSNSVVEKLPGWVPHQKVNLGLDLRGGSHLLLEVDFNAYMQEQLSNMEDTLRRELRKNKIPYAQLATRKEVVSFTVRNSADTDKVSGLLRELSRDISIDKVNNGFRIGFNESYVKDQQTKLIDQSIEIIRRRIDETGTKEPSIQRQGENRILLQVPGLDNPEHLKRLLGKTAKLTFHLLDENASVEAALRGQVPPDSLLVYGEGSQGAQPYPYIIKKRAMLTGDVLTDARTSINDGNPVVAFSFNTLGAKLFGQITTENVGHLFAIVLDNKVISAPVIREPILGGSGVISGNFTVEGAGDLALLLRAGALPAPLHIIEERTVGPSLGADSIAAGKMAASVGVLLVMVFMVVSYGLFGLFANIALLINMLFLLAALSLLQATLTMPGIAGIVLTIGMSVDANVLIYERIREEIRQGATPFMATDRGFRHAMGTIMDSNITLLVASILLYIFGSGTIKGFAVTLALGILTSMFNAVTLSRFIIASWLKYRKPKTLAI